MQVRTNMPAMRTHLNLKQANTRLATPMQRLSSGLRINSAADDSAGLGISEKMQAQIRGLDQASRNANDAISLVQTAEGAMSTITDMIIRVRELLIQAMNDTIVHGEVDHMSDRRRIQDEIDQLLDEIEQTADRTNFNTQQLIDGSWASNRGVTDAASPMFVDRMGVRFTVEELSDTRLPARVLGPNNRPAFMDHATGNMFTQEPNGNIVDQSGRPAFFIGNDIYLANADNRLTNLDGDLVFVIADGTIAPPNVAAGTEVFQVHVGPDGKLTAVNPNGSQAVTSATPPALVNITIGGLTEGRIPRLKDTDITGNLATQLVDVYKYNFNTDHTKPPRFIAEPGDLLPNPPFRPLPVGGTTTTPQVAKGGESFLMNITPGYVPGTPDTTEPDFIPNPGYNPDEPDDDDTNPPMIPNPDAGDTIPGTPAQGTPPFFIGLDRNDPTIDPARVFEWYTGDTRPNVNLRQTVFNPLEQFAGNQLFFQIGANQSQNITLHIESVRVRDLGDLFVMRSWFTNPDNTRTNFDTLYPNFEFGDIDIEGPIGAVDHNWTDAFRDDGLGPGVLFMTGEQIDALGLIDIVDYAMSIVVGERSKLGAVQNRLEYVIQNVDTSSVNLSDARSRVMDANMALESARFAQHNVVQQAAMAMMSQANNMPFQFLQLLPQ